MGHYRQSHQWLVPVFLTELLQPPYLGHLKYGYVTLLGISASILEPEVITMCMYTSG